MGLPIPKLTARSLVRFPARPNAQQAGQENVPNVIQLSSDQWPWSSRIICDVYITYNIYNPIPKLTARSLVRFPARPNTQQARQENVPNGIQLSSDHGHHVNLSQLLNTSIIPSPK